MTGLLLALAASAARTPTTASSPSVPECPPGLACTFVPAAYGPTVPGNPSDYGNYDHADRPADGNDIRFVVIHDTEEGYAAAMRDSAGPAAVSPRTT